MRVSESWMACSWQEPMWSSSSSTSVICCISTIFCNRMEFHLLAFCCVQLVRNCLYHFPSLPEGEETNLPPGAFKVSCYLCCFLPIVSHCLMGTGKKGFHLSRSLSMLSQTRIKYLHTQSLNFALKCTWIVKVNGLFWGLLVFLIAVLLYLAFLTRIWLKQCFHSREESQFLPIRIFIKHAVKELRSIQELHECVLWKKQYLSTSVRSIYYLG